jgi:hypothetical protein
MRPPQKKKIATFEEIISSIKADLAATHAKIDANHAALIALLTPLCQGTSLPPASPMLAMTLLLPTPADLALVELPLSPTPADGLQGSIGDVPTPPLSPLPLQEGFSSPASPYCETRRRWHIVHTALVSLGK